MGTRNLTMVYLDGEYKIAQYGQWDGYPEGQGMTCLNFARKLAVDKVKETFIEKLRALQEYTQADIDDINKRIESGELKKWKEVYPALSRDTGGEILDFILGAPLGEKVNISINFAADSLFCEWGWLIDLDNNKFEAYAGFNKEPLTEEDRFYFLADKEDKDFKTDGKPYCAIKKVAEWDLENLPSDEEFLAEFAEDEEED